MPTAVQTSARQHNNGNATPVKHKQHNSGTVAASTDEAI